MPAEAFTISSVNPNEGVGGGGCVCSPLKHSDQKGPFAVFYAEQMESNLSPHVVLCAGCAFSVCARAEGEHLHAGEPDTVDGSAEEIIGL